MEKSLKGRVISGTLWNFCQKISAQLMSLVISIVLARLLTPDDYGIVAMITVFTNIAMVFITTGFSSAIIQKKELSEADISTMFYSGLALSLVLYGILFFAAPYIAIMYKEPLLTDMIRVESLIVVLGASYSVQQALISRNLQYKKNFFIGAVCVIVQGISGITFAMNGFGPWSLVFSTLIHYFAHSVLMWCVVKWKPKLIFSTRSFKAMFGFSTKMLAAGLLNAVFNNIRSLIIGVRYTSADLAYYNKGYQYPTLIMTQVDGTINTVLFSSLSKYQSDWDAGLKVLRRAMKISLYVCLPLMAGMCAVADPMIRLLLTDKWEGSIVYVRLVAIICMFWPLSAQRNALNARGRSDVSLKMNIIGKIVTVTCLLSTFYHSVQLMITGSIIASSIGLVINSFFYRKYLDYSFRDQVADILPPVLLSACMGFITYSVMLLNLSSALTLLIQIPLGIVVYVVGSILFRFDSFHYLLGLIKDFFKRKK